MNAQTEITDSAKTTTVVVVRCLGHVRSVVGAGQLEFEFSGSTLREFLREFFQEYAVEDLIIAADEANAVAPGWAPAPGKLPGSWAKNPVGDQTRAFARVTVNGVFNEHLDGLDTELETGDRIALIYPFMFCV